MAHSTTTTLNNLISQGKINAAKSQDYQAILDFAAGCGALHMLVEDLEQLPARHHQFQGADVGSIGLHQQIEKRCRELGKDPGKAEDYAEAMNALGITY